MPHDELFQELVQASQKLSVANKRASTLISSIEATLSTAGAVATVSVEVDVTDDVVQERYPIKRRVLWARAGDAFRLQLEHYWTDEEKGKDIISRSWEWSTARVSKSCKRCAHCRN